MGDLRHEINIVNGEIATAERSIASLERRMLLLGKDRDRLTAQLAADQEAAMKRDKRRAEAESKFQTPEDMFARIDPDDLPAVPIPVIHGHNEPNMHGLIATVDYECDHPFYGGLRFDWYVCGKHYRQSMNRTHADAHGSTILRDDRHWRAGGRVTCFVRPVIQNRDERYHYGNSYGGNQTGSDFWKLNGGGGAGWRTEFDIQRTR